MSPSGARQAKVKGVEHRQANKQALQPLKSAAAAAVPGAPPSTRAQALAAAAQAGVDRLGSRIAAQAHGTASVAGSASGFGKHRSAGLAGASEFRKDACDQEPAVNVASLSLQAKREAGMARIPPEDCREASIAAPRCMNVVGVAGVSLRGHNPMLRKTN